MPAGGGHGIRIRKQETPSAGRGFHLRPLRADRPQNPLLLHGGRVHGAERSQCPIPVVEGQFTLPDSVTVHLVEHPHEGLLVLQIGAGHAGHAEVLHLQPVPVERIFAEEAIAVRASRDERIGRIKPQCKEIGFGIDRRSGDCLHRGQISGRPLQRGVVRAAAGGHRKEQRGGCKELFHRAKHI